MTDMLKLKSPCASLPDRVDTFKIKKIDDTFQIHVNNGDDKYGKIRLDRNQADFLRLYLDENLK